MLDPSSENSQAWRDIDYSYWHEDRIYLNKEEIVFDIEESEPVQTKDDLSPTISSVMEGSPLFMHIDKTAKSKISMELKLPYLSTKRTEINW